MLRIARALPLLCVGQAGCSLVLDFSSSAIPIDAGPDAPATAEECMFAEPNDSFAMAVDLPVTSVGPGAICASGFDDHDFYKIAVPAATATMTIQISFINSQSGDLDLYLYDAAGTQISLSVGTSDNEKITCPGASPSCSLASPIPEGNYVFEVRGGVSGSQNRYDIAVTLTQ